MKSSEMLREAARLVERGRYIGGCPAIDSVSFDCGDGYLDGKLAQTIFERCFFDRWAVPSGYWWPEEYRHGPRIIGLCLAAAIAESEGD